MVLAPKSSPPWQPIRDQFSKNNYVTTTSFIQLILTKKQLAQLTVIAPYINQMEDNIVNSVIELHRQGNWRDITSKYHDHPERNKLLWVFPDESNFEFIKKCAQELNCDRMLSIGCGSGLLEWMITAATGIPVSGLEVDGTWWHCKYAPPTFIPLLLTSHTLDKDTKIMLNTCDHTNTALLFCYFNNRPAFEDYLTNFSGNVIIIIGPDGKGVHTDPKPFGDVSADWILYKWQEVRKTKDFIAVYLNKNSLNK